MVVAVAAIASISAALPRSSSTDCSASVRLACVGVSAVRRMARAPTKTMGPNMTSLANFLHDFQLVRRAADLVVATRKDLRRWHEPTVTAVQVNTWISAEL